MQVAPRTGPVREDERQRIIDLYCSGTKVAHICRLTGRCRSSVYMVVNDAAHSTGTLPLARRYARLAKFAVSRSGMCRQAVAVKSPA